jgi:hypothetical protein
MALGDTGQLVTGLEISKWGLNIRKNSSNTCFFEK